MTGPHPRATGSYGPEMLAWSAQRFGMHPKRTAGHRWWAELVAHRALEHDSDGRLVWSTVVLSTSRQSGKSWLARELCLWRLSLADRLGEVQTVVHTAAQLKHAYSVWRPAAFWARNNGYAVRLANGEQQIAAADGSAWMIQAANDGLGVSLSVGLGFVDEAWDVPRELIENGLAPTMAEAEQPQLWLVSTAGLPRVGSASDLMPTYRRAGFAQLDAPRDVLFVEWSAPRDADIDDPATWRAASPHFDDRRLATVEGKRVAAASPGALAAFRLQWLNQWPEDTRTVRAWLDPAAVAGCGVEHVVPDGTVGAVEQQLESVLFSAAFGGRGGVELLVDVPRPVAVGWLAARDPSVVLAHQAVANQLEGALPVRVVRSGEVSASVSMLEEAVSGGSVKFDNPRVMADQFAGARLVSGEGGRRISARDSDSGTAALKALSWVVWHSTQEAPDVAMVF